MASTSSLMLFITYLLLFNIFSDGLHFLNDGNDVDTYEIADITTTESPDVHMLEGGKVIINGLLHW